MRKVDDGKKKEKKEKENKRFLVATMSLPAVDRPNADRWNAARSCQLYLELHREDMTVSGITFPNQIELHVVFRDCTIT